MLQKRTIGNYKIQEELKTGGMARIYLAEHPVLKKPVVIKELKVPPNDEIVQRFIREAKIMQDLRNDHIVSVYDQLKEDETYYLVMEYVPGLSLQELMDRTGKVPPEIALTVLFQTLTGLAYAHEKGVIHRDIKPANILISRGGDVKLVDFGIAHSDDDRGQDLTDTGIIMGTPLYMSPEQFSDAKNVDARSDIYSLGVVTYLMLTGKKPFPGTLDGETIAKVQKGKYIHPGRIEKGLPGSLCGLIGKMMHHKRERRFQSSGAVLSKVSRLLEKRKGNDEGRGMLRDYLFGREEFVSGFSRRHRFLNRLIFTAAGSLLIAVLFLLLFTGGRFYRIFMPKSYGYITAALTGVRSDRAEWELKTADSAKVLKSGLYSGDSPGRLTSSRIWVKSGVYILRSVNEYIDIDSTVMVFPLAEKNEGNNVVNAVPAPEKRQVRVAVQVIDAMTGVQVQFSTGLFYREKGASVWRPVVMTQSNPWSAANSTDYQLRLVLTGYTESFLDFRVEPGTERKILTVQAVPLAGTLRLKSNMRGMQVFLNGSKRYFFPGVSPEYRRTPRTAEGEVSFDLMPGEYDLSVKSGGTESTLPITVRPGKTLSLTALYDKAAGNLTITR